MRLSKIVSGDIAPPARPRLTSPTRLHDAIASIRDRWPDVVPQPPEKDRDAILRALRDRIRRNDWQGARMREVTAAAHAAFDPVRVARDEFEIVREFLIAELRASTVPGFLGAMAVVQMESFSPNAPHTLALCAALQDVSPRIPGQRRTPLENAPELLDPVHGPERLARRMLAAPEPFGALKALGIVAPHGKGFMDHAHRSFVAAMRDRLAPGDRGETERLLAWLHPPGRAARKTDAALGISALLAPWTRQAAPEDLRTRLIAALTVGWGDPRLPDADGAWVDVPKDEKAVFYRWLTGETLEAFLEIMSEQKESDTVDAERMWLNRVEFWRDLYRSGKIDAAWVALTNDGAEVARRRAKRSGNESLATVFGRQTAGGSRRKTSILILKCGDKIIVEGSDSYKVHIFRASDAKAPQLYQPQYDCESIRRTLNEREKRAHNGDWTGWVMERI